MLLSLSTPPMKRAQQVILVPRNGYLVTRSSSKTKCAAQSSTEAESIAASKGFRTDFYMENINTKILSFQFDLSLFKNNHRSIKWFNNATRYQAKTKQLDTCYSFALELHQEGIFCMM